MHIRLSMITSIRSRYQFQSYRVGDEVTSETGDIVEPGELSSQLNAAVGLPASLFQQINDRPNVGILFAFYESSSLFSIAGETNSSDSPIRTVVGSQVLAATVGSGINFQNLNEAVMIIFRLQVPEGSVSFLFKEVFDLVQIDLLLIH